MHGVHVMVHTLRFRRKEPGCQGFPRKEPFVKYFLPAACRKNGLYEHCVICMVYMIPGTRYGAMCFV